MCYPLKCVWSNETDEFDQGFQVFNFHNSSKPQKNNRQGGLQGGVVVGENTTSDLAGMATSLESTKSSTDPQPLRSQVT